MIVKFIQCIVTNKKYETVSINNNEIVWGIIITLQTCNIMKKKHIKQHSQSVIKKKSRGKC